MPKISAPVGDSRVSMPNLQPFSLLVLVEDFQTRHLTVFISQNGCKKTQTAGEAFSP